MRSQRLGGPERSDEWACCLAPSLAPSLNVLNGGFETDDAILHLIGQAVRVQPRVPSTVSLVSPSAIESRITSHADKYNRAYSYWQPALCLRDYILRLTLGPMRQH